MHKNKIAINGSCQCGAITFQCKSPPATVYLCHCSHCQAQSSSAFGMSVWLNTEDTTFAGLTPERFNLTADSGADKYAYFCPQCGTRLYHGGNHGTHISVKGGSLAEINDLQPIADIWTKSALPWVALDPARRQYSTQPDDFAELVDLYQQSQNQAK